MVTSGYAGADWVERTRGAPISELGRAVADMLGATFEGIYHLPGVRDVRWHEREVITVLYWGALSTYDDDRLTRLVVMSHDRAIRMQVRPLLVFVEYGENEHGEIREREGDMTVPMATLELMFTQRRREGSIFERHPSLHEAAASARRL